MPRCAKIESGKFRQLHMKAIHSEHCQCGKILMRSRTIPDDIGLVAGLHHHVLAKKAVRPGPLRAMAGVAAQSFPMEKTSFKRDDRVELEFF